MVLYMDLESLCCFFFFFKQKTAYEMRISDWSSDVCSSDLAGHPAPGRRGAGAARGPGGPPHRPRRTPAVPEGTGLQAADRPLREIGRASCRERVCQYV